jgi:hypothetical protein
MRSHDEPRVLCGCVCVSSLYVQTYTPEKGSTADVNVYNDIAFYGDEF